MNIKSILTNNYYKNKANFNSIIRQINDSKHRIKISKCPVTNKIDLLQLNRSLDQYLIDVLNLSSSHTKKLNLEQKLSLIYPSELVKQIIRGN